MLTEKLLKTKLIGGKRKENTKRWKCLQKEIAEKGMAEGNSGLY